MKQPTPSGGVGSSARADPAAQRLHRQQHTAEQTAVLRACRRARPAPVSSSSSDDEDSDDPDDRRTSRPPCAPPLQSGPQPRQRQRRRRRQPAPPDGLLPGDAAAKKLYNEHQLQEGAIMRAVEHPVPQHGSTSTGRPPRTVRVQTLNVRGLKLRSTKVGQLEPFLGRGGRVHAPGGHGADVLVLTETQLRTQDPVRAARVYAPGCVSF